MEVNSKGMDLWLLILLVICMSTTLVESQLDANGFINIDCGRAPNSSFNDNRIESTYVSDDQFIDTGENHRIDSMYATQGLYQELLTVRSFPSGTRNCYTLRSLTIGSKYLVRAQFMYANYDNLNNPPTFELYLGVNYWDTMETTTDDNFFTEIIATATADFIQVCLINKKLGTPFISVLHLSQLKSSMYKDVDSTQSLVIHSQRANLGASDELRYPDDSLDRLWSPNTSTASWKSISTSSTVSTDPDFATPSAVLQTAVTTLNTTQPLTFDWTSDVSSELFFIILHFSEIGNLMSTDLREFDIFLNGILKLNKSYVPDKLDSGWVTFYASDNDEYNVSLKASSRSTLPPLLNAYELYVVTPATGVPTNIGDVAAVNTIKANYNVNKGWSGDPCVPTEYSWNSISCTTDSKNIPRIATLDLSSSGLTGAIISSFGNLSALTSLDLSNNDLSGDLPAFLDKLSALKFLDITGNNKLSTTLPPGLQSKKQNGNLIFMSGQRKKKKSLVVIIVVVIGVVVLFLIAAIITICVCLRKRKNHQDVQRPTVGYGTKPHQAQNLSNASYANISEPNVAVEGRLDFENRRYSYNDLVRITNKFQNHIGTGGFGSVYLGFLDDDMQVAVKMRSHSSSQGVKEFLAEAHNLARVHHKNLVSLIGYCMDGDHMALVYEYMQQGTLQEKLRDNARPLSWKQRIRIAYESALGLEYLHKSCNPPLIHRDVKTSNILLNENLVAKIADFGLSREFNSAASSHVSTLVVGTPGYLDPEYYSSFQLSVKSDVFSFGVVLLEIITGKPPNIPGTEGSHLKQWVNQKLSRGDIESIVDLKMQGQYDLNSVWKVAEVALKCTEDISAKRPTMSMVVLELEESLALEISTEGVGDKDTANYDPDNYSRNENFESAVSQNIVMEMAYFGGMEGPAPEAR